MTLLSMSARYPWAWRRSNTSESWWSMISPRWRREMRNLTSWDWLPGLYTAVSCKAMVSISDSKEMYYVESGALDHLTLHKAIYIANQKFNKPIDIPAANGGWICTYGSGTLWVMTLVSGLEWGFIDSTQPTIHERVSSIATEIGGASILILTPLPSHPHTSPLLQAPNLCEERTPSRHGWTHSRGFLDVCTPSTRLGGSAPLFQHALAMQLPRAGCLQMVEYPLW